ncbi:hypothetical protein BH24GEM1_BH24GEM1_28080 [soil metagenome]
MYRLLEDSGFTRVRSAVVPGCRFRKSATQDAAEAYGAATISDTERFGVPLDRAELSWSRTQD